MRDESTALCILHPTSGDLYLYAWSGLGWNSGNTNLRCPVEGKITSDSLWRV